MIEIQCFTKIYILKTISQIYDLKNLEKFQIKTWSLSRYSENFHELY